MAETIKLKDFIQQDIDLDIADDVCEELYIGFVGPLNLTQAGKDKFGKLLDLDVEVSEDSALLLLDGREDWQGLLKLAKVLFTAAAGYCSESDWNKWFQS